MELINIYECFCDRTRLRIVSLLLQGPLCVCHLQDVLGEPQVKVSKHLGYLKTRGVVTVTREGNWRIYRLNTKPTPTLKANLSCLRNCANDDKNFRRDTEKLAKLLRTRNAGGPTCCGMARK